MATIAMPHIYLDDQGIAWIEGANTKVIEVAIDKIAHGWSPEEMQFQHPHLSLAEIHAALAYYYDHQSELDSEIDRRTRDSEAMRAAAGPSAAESRLRRSGLLH